MGKCVVESKQDDVCDGVYSEDMSPSTLPDARRSTSASTRPASGMRLVLTLVILGIGLASFAIWFQWQQTRRCLELYGSAVARRIQAAPRVELWEPQDGAETGGRAAVAPAHESARRFDVSRARGLVHLRRGLVEDANFDWSKRAGGGAAWDAALAFYDRPDDREPAAVLVFDFDPAGGTLSLVGRGNAVGLGRLEKGLRAWLTAARSETGPMSGANRAF